ncbi:hypothetical protein EYC80_002092 [Monilinia laxa]|uniref:Uncharacterized protein n=1 Tax=Monilinia laxa TaxID=61186 RepID=A0A5N6K2S8_MONLA|nr:hypothetical protein EYC80_002092 [Monilinia laxa]
MGCTHSKQSLPSPPPSTTSTYLPRNSSSSSLPATRFVNLAQPNRVTTIKDSDIDNDCSHAANSTNIQPTNDEDAARSNEREGSYEERCKQLPVRRSLGGGVGDKTGRRRPGQSIEDAGLAVAALGTG